MSSQGSPEAVQEGRKTILYAAIGLVITSLAFVIVNFAINTIYGKQPQGGDSESETVSSGVDSSGASGSDIDDWEEYEEVGAGSGDNGGITEGARVAMMSQKRIYVGDNEQLRAHIIPYSKSSSITWVSDNPSIVSVDEQGKIEAKREGTATITASIDNGKAASTNIIVIKPIEPESVELSPDRVSMFSGKKYNLVARVLPGNANNKHVTWSTDNATVATVNDRGQISGKKEGIANITAKTVNGKSATIQVKVTDDDGKSIKITKKLLNELDYFYQTNHQEPINSRCGINAGDVSCGPATYMVAVYVLTGQKIDYPSFASEACGRWMEHAGSSIQKMSTVFAQEYESKYHVRVKNMPYNWDSVVKELKKGHPVILFVHWAGAPSGFTFTYGAHYVIALSYRNRGGGQVYIWSPVSEKAAPGRNIGDCSEGECWYDKSTYTLNVNDNAWSVQKI